MSGYIGPIPVPQGVQNKETFTATASQTTFNTNGYTDGDFINVYLNGVRLINGTDYTATNGSDIVLTTGASASDVLDFETINEVQLVSNTSTTPIFKTSATLKNDTEEDTDGGRESTLIFQGEQSGGEISTLAEIEASHDGTSDDEKGDLIFRTNDGSDGSSPTEAARIDSDQNFLVSKTSAGAATAGFETRSSGYTAITRDGGQPLEVRRLTSDGVLIDLRKDSTSVGNITVDSGDNIAFGAITAGGAGFYLAGASGTDPFVLPMKEGALSDDAVTLGDSSRRYKDIFLSGGAYIGGTGAANYLDDYEEGTWTPSDSSGNLTFSSVGATYTKIGNRVLFTCNIVCSSSSSSTAFAVSGLPFTCASGKDGAGSLAYTTMTSSRTHGHALLIQGTSIYFYYNGASQVPIADVSSAQVRFSGNYNI